MIFLVSLKKISLMHRKCRCPAVDMASSERYSKLIRSESHKVSYESNMMSGCGDNDRKRIDQSNTSIWWKMTEQLSF